LLSSFIEKKNIICFVDYLGGLLEQKVDIIVVIVASEYALVFEDFSSRLGLCPCSIKLCFYFSAFAFLQT
jgi:hypothetical protein